MTRSIRSIQAFYSTDLTVLIIKIFLLDSGTGILLIIIIIIINLIVAPCIFIETLQFINQRMHK